MERDVESNGYESHGSHSHSHHSLPMETCTTGSHSLQPTFSETFGRIGRWRRHSIGSIGSAYTTGSLDSISRSTVLGQLMVHTRFLRTQTRIKDESGVFPVCLIFVSLLVAVSCSLAAFLLHFSVNLIGCLGGLNGCHDQLLLDMLEPYGIGTSMFFIVSSGLSGLCCSFIIYSPFQGGIARRCKGGGSADTKIVISSGATVSGWVVILRILLATLYMGGGNPLGTEGPIIHTSSSLAIWLVSKSGKKRRKLLSTFGVIGAAAGISAGFNVHVTGFVYVIEEIARTLSGKLALVLAFVAGTAVFLKDLLEELLHHWFHQEHTSLVPKQSTWASLTNSDRKLLLLLCVPIGVFTGIAGWIFTDSAWALMKFLNPKIVGEEPSRLKRIFLPERLHLAIVGVVCGCLGAIAFEITGMNGVWGTTAGAIPEAIAKNLSWDQILLLFAAKFLAFILATAAAGPGGLLVPSLVTGGFLGLAVAKFIGVNESTSAACAVIGMGSMFASVMHMPVTGVIIIFELTRADGLSLHIALANFIASNVVYRLPHGTHSFVHRTLALDPTWEKLDQRDFIETDVHEIEADVALFKSTLSLWLTNDSERLRSSFESWRDYVRKKNMSLPRKVRRTRTVLLEEAIQEPEPDGEPQRYKSEDSVSRFNSQGSIQSSVSNKSSKSSLVSWDAQRRREQREIWQSVSSVIPGLNWRQWKSLNIDQRLSLAEAADVVAHAPPVTPRSPKSNWEPEPHPQKPSPPPKASLIDDGLLDWHSLTEGPHWAMDPCMQRKAFYGNRNILNEGGTGGPTKVLGVTVPHPLICTPRKVKTPRNLGPDLESSTRNSVCAFCATPTTPRQSLPQTSPQPSPLPSPQSSCRGSQI